MPDHHKTSLQPLGAASIQDLGVLGFRWSPGDTMLAALDGKGILRVRPADAEDPLHASSGVGLGDDRVNGFAYSPDSRRDLSIVGSKHFLKWRVVYANISLPRIAAWHCIQTLAWATQTEVVVLSMCAHFLGVPCTDESKRLIQHRAYNNRDIPVRWRRDSWFHFANDASDPAMSVLDAQVKEQVGYTPHHEAVVGSAVSGDDCCIGLAAGSNGAGIFTQERCDGRWRSGLT